MVHFKSFSITSSHSSVSRLPLQNFMLDPAVIRAGWRLKQLVGLMSTLQNTLQKFEYMTSYQIRYELIFKLEHPEELMTSYKRNAHDKKIHIYLQKGPTRVLATVPLLMAQDLANVFLEVFTKGQALTTGISFNVIEDISRIEQGLRMIHTFYTRERGTVVDAKGMRGIFISLVEHYGLDLVRRKIGYEMLGHGIKPAQDIEATINVVLADFTKKVNKPIIDPKEIPLWSMIAMLAMLATLAKKYGPAQSYLRAQEVLNGQTGRQIASMEILTIPDQDLKYFQQYPLELERQLKLGPAGYNVVFNAFQQVFEFYFDRVRIS